MFRAFFAAVMAGFVIHVVFRTTCAAIFAQLSMAFLLGAMVYAFVHFNS